MSKGKEMPQAAASITGAKTEPDMALPAEKPEKKGDLAYLGPTITGAARHGTVFKNGILPEKAQECIAELPQMFRLFVGVDKMPEAIRELKKKQSTLRAVYDQTVAHFNAQKFTRRV